MFFIEDMVTLDDIQKQFISQVTTNDGARFPYYLCFTTRPMQAFVHKLMERNKEKKDDSGKIISTAYDFFHNIFINFC